MVGGRHLGTLAAARAGHGRCGGRDRLGRVGGLHYRARPPARGRRPNRTPDEARRAKRGRGDRTPDREAMAKSGGSVGGGGERNEGLGRSRGGFTSKIHLSADGLCRPLSLIVTAGQRADCTQFTSVLERIRVPRLGAGRPRRKPDSVAADKAYSNGACRQYLRQRRSGGGCAAPCAEGKCGPLRSATASTTPRGSARIAAMPRSRGRRGSGGGKSHVCRSPRQWDSERVLFVEYDGPVPRALMARIGEVCGTPVTSRRC